MSKPTAMSTAWTGLLLAALALPYGPSAAAPQDADSSGLGRDCRAVDAAVIDDQDPAVLFRGPPRRPLTPEEADRIIAEVTGIIARSPSAPPSRLLGTRLPKSVDLRDELPPVAIQGDGGSNLCVTFATGYYQATQSLKHFRHPAWDLKNPEHQVSVAFVASQGGTGFTDYVYRVLQENGTVDTAEMPFDSKIPVVDNQPTPDQFEAAKPYRIGPSATLWNNGGGSHNKPFDNPIENARAWLADGFVLSCSVDPDAKYGFPGGCVPPVAFFDPPTQSNFWPGHGVALVGYHDQIHPAGQGAEHRGGFLMVNSHGPRWNGDMNGYLWLSYAYVRRYVGDCSIMVPGGPAIPEVTGYTHGNQEGQPTVIITGTNFGSLRRLAGVEFNGVAAGKVWRFTNDAIEVTPQSPIKAGPLVVYNWEGTRSKAIRFTPPRISTRK